MLDSNKLPDSNILKVYKTCPEAVLPFKTYQTDAGYDLTILSKYKDLDSQTALYDTGIKIDLPEGTYGLIYPRSSLSKSGYILANSVGVIDYGYHGNIYIALRRVREDAAEISFPFRCCQLIINLLPKFTIQESLTEFSESQRNTGGFGSTGN